MDINDLFDFSKPFVRKDVSGGTVAGRTREMTTTTKVEPSRILPSTTDYSNKYVKDLHEHLRVRFNIGSRQSDEDENPKESIYDKYDFEYHSPSNPLPIASSRDKILATIKENTVVVLQGSTGCGKTTQVPQYILDDARAQGKYCNIVVAQPRRIAAQTNAQRVCKERGWKIGKVVGYQVGSDQQTNRSEDTRILYCTTGVLLEKLIHAKSLYHYTHIILDEVHERTKEMDFLMVIIYKFLNPRKKVILMSATIDSKTFSDYFKLPSARDSKQFVSAPIVKIDADSNYEVKKYYLDELEVALQRHEPNYRNNMNLDLGRPKIFEDQYTWALRLICLFERMDSIEWSASGKPIDEYESGPKPTVLVFLPGINEIMLMYRVLEEWKHLNQETEVLRIVLHSTADPLQAYAAMQQTGRNIRKVILATNIAESSITVPDVKYVIDFCLTRNLVTDKETNFSSLRLAWASKNNCEQRAGRTGRVMPGKCFRLVTKEFYNKLRLSAHPEIIHSPLESIVLKIKVLDMGSPESILALAMEKPKLNEIGNTVLRLKEMQALLRTKNGYMFELDGDITFIGRVMASLPIDPKLSKMIVYGYCFSVLNECVVIAAALNCTKNIFKFVRDDGVRAYDRWLEWANGSGSDLFGMLNAYNRWSQMRKNKRFGTGTTKAERERMDENEKKWANKYNLEVQALRECETYVNDLHLRLKRLELKALDHEKFKWTAIEKNVILKVVISGAFYPNYFLRASPNRSQNEREMFNQLDGRDPTKTIIMNGFENGKYLRNIYVETIKNRFVESGVVDDKNKMKVTFDSGAQKVYVTFKTDGKKDDVREYGVACQPGFALTEVYKAIRMRKVKGPTIIPVIGDYKLECDYARQYNLYVDESTLMVRVEDEKEYRTICFPKVLDCKVNGSITHIENCDEFYLQPEKVFHKVAKFREEINNDLEPFEMSNEIHIGEILAAPYYESDPRQVEYYRAKILNVSDSDPRDPKFTVRFIDFGNTTICKFKDLRKLSGDSAEFIRVPPQCFRCALAGIQPSILNAPNGIWPKKAIELFRELTGENVEAEVYSTFDGIARVIIRTHNDINVNDLLVQRGYAETCEENYMSKENHLERKKKQMNSHTMQQTPNYLDDGTLRYLREEDFPEIRRPSSRLTPNEVILKGPISPLEIEIYPLTRGGKSRIVTIDNDSVNVVMLENEPNDISLKYLVAVSVCQKVDSNDKTTDKISVRQTTMMPHIRAFGPLMAAIFCPTMEMARDKSNSHYISMITGLGYDELAGRPIFAENDMTFDLDTEITIEDLENVNMIRHCMNSLLFTEADQRLAINFDDATKNQLMKKIRELIVNLLKKKRHSIAYDPGEIAWNRYDPQEAIQPETDQQYDLRAIFPLHKILKLEKESAFALVASKNHHKELCQAAQSERPVTRNFTCKLCNDPSIEDTIALRRHLMSRVHVDRLSAIESTLQKQYGNEQ